MKKMQQKGLSFWKRVLLNNFADDCIAHVIIPTSLASLCMDKEKFANAIVAKHGTEDVDDNVLPAQTANITCCWCNRAAFSDFAQTCVRILVAKRQAKRIDDGSSAFVYRVGIGSAVMCSKCAQQQRFVSIDSNSDIQEVMFERLEAIGRDLSVENLGVDLSGDEFVSRMLDRFDLGHRFFMKEIGGIDVKCGHCKKPNPTKACGGCLYARYCDAACSKADWKLHKPECAILKENSVFYRGKQIKLV